jgi:hypothetical protein
MVSLACTSLVVGVLPFEVSVLVCSASQDVNVIAATDSITKGILFIEIWFAQK